MNLPQREIEGASFFHHFFFKPHKCVVIQSAWWYKIDKDRNGALDLTEFIDFCCLPEITQFLGRLEQAADAASVRRSVLCTPLMTFFPKIFIHTYHFLVVNLVG